MRQGVEKVVVIGGAGFVGSHLVDRLLADSDFEVVVFDNLSRGRRANLARHQTERRLRVVEADVRHAEAVATALHGADVVYYLAAWRPVTGAVNDLAEAFSTDVGGTLNVLVTAARGAIDHLIFASSRDVYGEPISLPVDESHPLLPINIRGVGKVVGEVYCRAFRQIFGLQTTVLRFSNVYGPRDSGHVIPAWLDCARAGQDLRVYGGEQVIDLIWVEQAVEALVRVAALEGPLPPINVGSGTGTRMIDVARRVARLTGRQAQLRLLPARAAEIMRFVANVDRMRQVLSIEPPLDPLVHLPGLLAAPVGMVS